VSARLTLTIISVVFYKNEKNSGNLAMNQIRTSFLETKLAMMFSLPMHRDRVGGLSHDREVKKRNPDGVLSYTTGGTSNGQTTACVTNSLRNRDANPLIYFFTSVFGGKILPSSFCSSLKLP
jgi:hypothetical protein